MMRFRRFAISPVWMVDHRFHFRSRNSPARIRWLWLMPSWQRLKRSNRLCLRIFQSLREEISPFSSDVPSMISSITYYSEAFWLRWLFFYSFAIFEAQLLRRPLFLFR